MMHAWISLMGLVIDLIWRYCVVSYYLSGFNYLIPKSCSYLLSYSELTVESPNLIHLAWLVWLALMLERKFSVGSTHACRLLTVAALCTCGHNKRKTKYWWIFLMGRWVFSNFGKKIDGKWIKLTGLFICRSWWTNGRVMG